MSQTKEEKFGTQPQVVTPQQWGKKPDAPTVRTMETIDEYRIIAKAFEKENIDLIMPVISADQYAAFDALVPNLTAFYTQRTEIWNPITKKVELAKTPAELDPLPPGTKEAFDFFEKFRVGYKSALTAENGYFGELISRWLESVKSAEQKGTGGSEPRRGWSRFFLGSH